MGQVLADTFNLLFTALTIIIFARVIISWLPQYRYSQIGVIIFNLSEPILRPIQNLIPPMGMIDLSPMIAIIVLWIAQVIVNTIIVTIFPM